MQKISRTSLAALVCPSAPFLAPRLLRTAVTRLPCAPSARSQRPTYATTPDWKDVIREFSPKGGIRSWRPHLPPLSKEAAETVDLLHRFRQACDTRNVQLLMELYPTLLAAKILNSFDTRRITQTLHVRIRNASPDSSQADLFPFVQQVADDLRRGALEPHGYAFVHLLGIYKDTRRFQEGYALWQWLVQQDERYVSQAAYGAAIELMAYGKLMGLPELEEIFVDGLKRFPGTFAAYHLSPDAIVPDRTQLTTIKGIPTILFQGILSARILARDWKRAYLALDTILRLYPTQTPTRYFQLFMTERPLSEAYTAFMVACRSGVCIRPTHVTVLISKLRAAITASHSMTDRMMLVRAIANALYAYLEAGGQLESIHVGSFVHSFEQVLPEPPAGQDYVGEAAEMRNIIVATAHEALSGLIQAGLAPRVHPFEALISLSGKMRVPRLLSTALQDVKKAGIELGPIGNRSVITSAGLLNDKHLIEQYWVHAVSAAEAESTQIPFEDWITFTKACRRADHAKYFRKQLVTLSYTVTASIERHLLQRIEQPETASASQESYHYMTLEELETDINVLKAQIRNIEAVVMAGQPLDLRKTPFYMHLDADHPSLGTDEDLRHLYDEFTIDPHQPPPPPPADGSPAQLALSPTGIPIDELRFQNWMTVLEMMDDAEAYESDLQFALNTAIKRGEPLKGNPELLRLRKDVSSKRTATGLRMRIKELRAINPADVNIFRKVGSEDGSKKMVKIQKHVAKDEGERVVNLVGPKGIAKLRYYVGLESHHTAPGGMKRSSLVRKTGFSDGKPVHEADEQQTTTSEPDEPPARASTT
ncbi:hypothetical protein BDW02DRAFT_565012 [Decorospora gaudefroyi]|uniref:Uncharacterized protein n=1 Tax=Decorospora gaudefroyi TaxID=184978 RepID=A0A6A5KV28_9PLEO|nr:hypothetical protein BDW02DRAFT_565012 [Decorospora gaudefroyi]